MMMNDTEKSVIDTVIRLIEKNSFLIYDKEQDQIKADIYADYHDEASDKTIIAWCQSKNPMEAFWESLYEWYQQAIWDLEDETISSVENNWDSRVHSYEDNAEYIADWIREHLCIELPEDHYLNQEVCVDIIVDTGDENYDYVLNDVYPHYDGRYEDTIPEEASILWLARQQGYNKRQLNAAMKKSVFADSKLLKSLRCEVINCHSHMNALTFFVKMTVKELFALQEAISDNAKNDIEDGGYKTVDQRKGKRKLTLSKDTACGLYDTWSGGGSLLEIELEKDVDLPLKFISTALPDGGRGWSAANVYGMCSSFWTPTVKKIA